MSSLLRCCSQLFNGLAFIPFCFRSTLGIAGGGISLSDPPDRVPEVCGEAADSDLDEDGFGYWHYRLRTENYLNFTQWDGELYSIGLSAHPDKSNPNSDLEESES